MWFRKKQSKIDEKEREIQRIQEETFKAVDRASEQTKKTNDLLERGGTTYLIYLATGGDRRNQ